jgi:hypothetical protein
MQDDPLDLPPRRSFSRRAFVKGCLLASAATVAGAGAQALVGPLSPPAGDARRVDYLGATVLSGPAPQGIPLLPLRVGEDGVVRGDAAPAGFEGGVLDWYRYCGHARDRALRPGWEGEEALVFTSTPEKAADMARLRAAGTEDAGWFLDRLGQPLRAADFRQRDLGASATWRGSVPVVVLRVNPAALRIEGSARSAVEGLLAPAPDGDALMAYVGYCKHLCCVPGWHEGMVALERGFPDTIYCACHHSVYDPWTIRPDFFVLRGA